MIGEDNCEEEVLTGARIGVREVVSEKRRVRRNSVLSCRRKRVSDGGRWQLRDGRRRCRWKRRRGMDD
jgi:hypothetical protein